MNCTRLSDMSDRLTTLEAKVRCSGDPGSRELMGEGGTSPRKPRRDQQSSLVLGDVCSLGPQWLWATFSKLGQPSGVGERSGVSKKSEGPRQ